MFPHHQTKVHSKKFVRPLHVGTENELLGVELILASQTGPMWNFVNISYDQQVVEGLSKTSVNDLPYAQIKVEGAASDPRFGTPEHIGGPLATGSQEHEIARQALQLLITRITALTQDASVPTVTVGAKAYRPLDTGITRYNADLDTKVAANGLNPLVRDAWRKFKLRTTRPSGATWYIRKRDHTGLQRVGTQVNIEIPFSAIGQPMGDEDLAERFGANRGKFTQCRDAAGTLVAATFSAARSAQKGGAVLPAHVKLHKLKSLFTLYYYSLVIHWETRAAAESVQRQMALLGQSQADRFEARATANKSRWVLLPKVKWADLFNSALSSDDRDILRAHMKNTTQWGLLKARMNVDIAAIVNPPNQHALNQFCDNYHDNLFKSVTWWFDSPTLAFSSTGKPLPVTRHEITKETITQGWDAAGYLEERSELRTRVVTEPVIVFEVRMSGDELQQAGKADARAIGDIGQVIDVITKLQLQ